MILNKLLEILRRASAFFTQHASASNSYLKQFLLVAGGSGSQLTNSFQHIVFHMIHFHSIHRSIGTKRVSFSSVFSSLGLESVNAEGQKSLGHLCIHAGPACWLWDYLRRSGASGYMLPLSGGADSSATAAIVGCMTQLVTKAVDAGDKLVEADARRCASDMCMIAQASPRKCTGDTRVYGQDQCQNLCWSLMHVCTRQAPESGHACVHKVATH